MPSFFPPSAHRSFTSPWRAPLRVPVPPQPRHPSTHLHNRCYKCYRMLHKFDSAPPPNHQLATAYGTNETKWNTFSNSLSPHPRPLPLPTANRQLPPNPADKLPNEPNSIANSFHFPLS